MSSTNKVKVVLVEELGDDIGPEGEGDAPVVFAPPGQVPLGVGPEQVAHKSVVRHGRRTQNPSDLLSKKGVAC
jgi:hypothetical protein